MGVQARNCRFDLLKCAHICIKLSTFVACKRENPTKIRPLTSLALRSPAAAGRRRLSSPSALFLNLPLYRANDSLIMIGDLLPAAP